MPVTPGCNTQRSRIVLGGARRDGRFDGVQYHCPCGDRDQKGGSGNDLHVGFDEPAADYAGRCSGIFMTEHQEGARGKG